MNAPRVSLALYKGRGLIGNALTRFWTGSRYSHCEMVIDGVCYSASFMDGGVRAKSINLASGNWDVLPAPWVDADSALSFFERTKGAKYDWLGIFGAQMFNRRRQNPLRWFCSEWFLAAAGVPTPEIHSPHTLGLLCNYLTGRA